MGFEKSNDITDKNIIDTIEAHKLESGCRGNIFENNHPILERYVNPYWVSHKWKFMWEKSIIIQEITPSLQPQTTNVTLITGDLIKLGFKGNELSGLNRFWMYIRVTYLSDISTGDGISISTSS